MGWDQEVYDPIADDFAAVLVLELRAHREEGCHGRCGECATKRSMLIRSARDPFTGRRGALRGDPDIQPVTDDIE